MSSVLKKTNKSIQHTIDKISSEKKNCHRDEFVSIYNGALDSLTSTQDILPKLEKSHRNTAKKCIKLKSTSTKYIEAGIKLSELLPEINNQIESEGKKIKELVSKRNMQDNVLMDGFIGGNALTKSIDLNLKMIEPTVSSATTTIDISNYYQQLTPLLSDFFISVVLGNETKTNNRKNIKNAAVIITGILGMAPVIGIPATLTNLLISINDMYNNTSLKESQSRLDQLELLTNATKLWEQAMVEWNHILKVHNLAIQAKVDTINDLTKSTITNLDHWDSRVKCS